MQRQRPMNKNNIRKAMLKLDKDSTMINRLKEFDLKQDCYKCKNLINKHDKALDISKEMKAHKAWHESLGI